MRPIDLAEMKDLELEILSQIDACCRRNGLRYFLACGTLLGAVRHGGFIPWDDDIDLLMPRDDYEKFFEVFAAEYGSSHLRLISYRDKSSIYPFIKIVDGRTVVEELYVNPKFRTGVWVDIFPLDGLPDDDAPFDANDKTKRTYDFVVANPEVATSTVRKLVKKVATPFAQRIDIFAKAAELDRLAAARPIDESHDLGEIIWGYGPRERMPYSFLETTEIEFEGRSFLAPRIYDEYLTRLYGDYMKLPPESERLPHYCNAYWKD